MESKPIITCHGDQTLFSSLHAAVVQGLPREPIEWRRSYGRAPRMIYVEANFVPFSVEILPKETDYSLVTRPFFYMYWTDCDMDTYKSTVREDIQTWLNRLKACHVTDWLIVVVVQDESKVKTKLLTRSSVVDKVRNDFCGKQGERCIALTEPFKADSKSAESWGNLLLRMRTLLLQSYNRSLLRFEEFMRGQRERRTEPGWNFCNYFMLQEELAFMFEILGLHDEALVQYDELDALFTQFVLNHAAGDTAEWLSTFTDSALQTWDGLSLIRPISWETRELIRKNRSSLLEFRNYLFSRQCALLLLMHRPWEIAQRSIPFMHNCIQELKMLEIKMPPGAVACWVFLSCLEIVQTCSRFRDSVYVEAYSLYTASLWEYARQKLLELGVLCGLMPDVQPSSQQLNMVVDLIAGLGHTSIGRNQVTREAMEKLREALSSKASFQKHYLELTELAMGTYKQIGRIRSARMIGKDLAKFYMKLGQPRKAEGFLNDALNTFKKENWDMLADHTRLEIAECQRVLKDDHKFARSCMYIACSPILGEDIRRKYQEDWLRVAATEQDEAILLRAHPVIIVQQMEPLSERFIVDEPVTVSLTLTCNLTTPLTCQTMTLSLSQLREELNSSNSQSEDEFRRRRRRHTSTSSVELTGVMTHNLSHPAHLDMQSHLQMQGDKAVTSSSLVCKSVLRRSDSGQTLRERDVIKDDCRFCLRAENVNLNPGENTVSLIGKVDERGVFNVNQLCARVVNLEMIKSLPQPGVKFEVVCEEPVVTLSTCSEVLWAGIPQYVHLKLYSGSRGFDAVTQLRLSSSDGLAVWFEDSEKQGDSVMIEKTSCDSWREFTVIVMADLPTNKECIENQITVHCDLLSAVHIEELLFRHPFHITHKLHTAGKRKFIQVMVHGQGTEEFRLTDQCLLCSSPDVSTVPLNPAGRIVNVNSSVSASFMWELKNNITTAAPLHCTFSVNYLALCQPNSMPRVCQYQCEVQGYKTLYIVKPEVVPTIDKEKCKAGEVCYLQVGVSSTDASETEERAGDSDSSPLLLYEVTPDNKYWAVSGKTTGVFELEGGMWDISVQLLPLMGGYLPLPKISLFRYLPVEMNKTIENSENSSHKKDEKDGYEETSDTVIVESSNTENKPVTMETSLNEPASHSKNESDTQTATLSKKHEQSESDQNNVTMTEEELGELVPFRHGQVYNSCVGAQVHVLPAQNISHVDVVVL